MSFTIEVLVATMNQKDHSLLQKMNIQSDAIVVNQCNENRIEEFEYNGHRIKWISLAERGVGLSRNTALMRSTADILLFADDDVVYKDDYVNIICSEYEKHPKSDMLVFNFNSLNKQRPEYLDIKWRRVRWYNSLRYGAFRFSIKRESLQKKNLVFSLLYGGGAVHQAGEDNLFIIQAIQKKIRVYASPLFLGTVAQEESTWFRGYDEKYYYDRGFLFANMFGWEALFILFLFEIKEGRQKSNFKFFTRLKFGKMGMNEYRTRKR